MIRIKQEVSKVFIHHDIKEGRDWWDRKLSNYTKTAHAGEENMANVRKDKGEEEDMRNKSERIDKREK